MNLEVGKQLSHYHLVEQIGEGGMGVVWKAQDSVLGRAVALKILPDVFADDAERLARFAQEARLLASLNHPNIAAIHGFEEDEAVRFLVLELVAGETLEERISRGRLPLAEAMAVGLQLAEALEAAHDKGIIHRDLKPANVKLTEEGTIKVLDFGLAKALAGEQPGSNPGASPSFIGHSPTMTTDRTKAGSIFGTATYMSPEQARGKPVDKRTDIWAFGCVMYECLTGRQPFPGETVSDVIGAILHLEPDWSRLPGDTPPRVERLLRHCFEKDPKKRLRDIGDARIEISGVRESQGGTKGGAATTPADKEVRIRIDPKRLGIGALLLFLGAALGIGTWIGLGPGSGEADVTVRDTTRARLSMTIPDSIRPSDTWGVTPDGDTLVFIGTPESAGNGEDPVSGIYARRMDSYELMLLDGTDSAAYFVISPDGRWIIFGARYSAETTQQKLAKIPIDGSAPPVTLADADDAWGGAAWLPDGDLLILIEEGHRYVRFPSGGGAAGTPVDVNMGEFEGRFNVPSAMAGGRAVLVNAITYGATGYNIGVGLVDLETNAARILIKTGGNARYVPTGHLLFSRGTTLLAASFDIDRLEVTGEPVALMGDLRTASAWNHGQFEVTGRGHLVFPPGGLIGAGRRISMLDQGGQVSPWSETRRAFELIPGAFDVSTDGRRVAVVTTSAKGIYEIWTSETRRPDLRRTVTLAAADATVPVWSPDGERLAFTRMARNEEDGIYWQPADGRDEPTRLLRTENPLTTIHYPISWAPDRSTLLIGRIRLGNFDILSLSLDDAADGPVEAAPLVSGDYNVGVAEFSPDGRWIAFSSDEAGPTEIYLAPYREDGTLGRRVRVSKGEGNRPFWNSDGRKLFYVAEGKYLTSVAITTGPRLTLGEPERLIDLREAGLASPVWGFDLLPDGRILFIEKGEGEDDSRRFNVVLNFSDELQHRVPSGRR